MPAQRGKQDEHGHRKCQNCHGHGTVTVINKKGRPEPQTCYACGGAGTVNPRLV
jgi:DnaJ-class molecular chaperone